MKTTNKTVTLSLDEYENMKGIIEDQKERIEELRNEKEPKLTVGVMFTYNNDIHRQHMIDWINELKPNYKAWMKIKVKEASDNEVVNSIVKAVNDKYSAAKSFEESAVQMLHGLQKQKEALEEAYKRAPWWCRWAIKSKTDES